MELLLTLTSSFLLALSFLSANCASDQLSLQRSLLRDDDAKISTQLWLPRKLNLHGQKVMKSSADEDFMRRKKLIEHSKGRKQQEKEENGMNVAEKGTWRESSTAEEEEHDDVINKQEYFTMDYGWVKRRRPIHNKQIPFVP